MYLITGFIANFGSTDKAITQIFYLSILNFFSIILLFYKKNQRLNFLKSVNRNLIFKIFLIFIFWALITIVFAVNKMESLRVMTDQVAYLFAIAVLYFLLIQPGIKEFLFKIVPVLLAVEILFICNVYFFDIIFSEEIIERSNRYTGITGNVNIAAFSIAIKLPFLIKNIFHKNIFLKLINFLIYSLGIYTIIEIHQTRGAFVALVCILFLYFIWLLFLLTKENIKSRIMKAIILVIPFIITLSISSFQQTKSIDRIVSISTLEDSSSSERFRYYGHAINSIMESPIFGIGIGNWELESIKRDIEYISNYIISYHVHNDFLEITAETGIIGFILFYGIAFYLWGFLLIKILKKRRELDFLIFTSLSIFFLDSFLNFPFARPIQMVHYFILLIIILVNNDIFRHSNFFNKINFGLIFQLSLITLPINIYASNRVYNSYVEQFQILGEFNAGQFITPFEKAKLYEDEFPSIGSTAIPLKTHKGIYYLRNDSLQQAKKLFKESINDNPYLKISESYLGYTYLKLKQLDSALYYTKDAFYTLPNNAVHYTYYLSVLSELNDTDEITNAYNLIKDTYGKEIIHEIYYLAMSRLLDKKESNDILNNLSKDLLLSDNDNLKKSIFIVKYGEKQVYEAGINHEKALQLFEQKKYQESLEFFERAAELNQLESPYFENAANAYLKVGNNERAFYFINFILENINPKNGKAHYMKALIELENEDNESACKSLLNANRYGFRGALRVYNAYCK